MRTFCYFLFCFSWKRNTNFLSTGNRAQVRRNGVGAWRRGQESPNHLADAQQSAVDRGVWTGVTRPTGPSTASFQHANHGITFQRFPVK